MSSLPLPSEPRRGDPVTADWARRVSAALRSLRLRGGPGVCVTTGPDGTTISAVRTTSGKKLVAIGAVPVEGGVLGAVDVAKRGPRTAVVYNPATREIGEAVVCPAEIAGQFPATDAHMETYVVAIQCVVSEAGSGAEGR